MDTTIIYCKNRYRCYFPICTKGIICHGKGNSASNNVENIDFPIVCFNCFYTSKDSKVLSTPTNKISYSKIVLTICWHVQGLRIELSMLLCTCTGYMVSYILSYTSIMNFYLRIVYFKEDENHHGFKTSYVSLML